MTTSGCAEFRPRCFGGCAPVLLLYKWTFVLLVHVFYDPVPRRDLSADRYSFRGNRSARSWREIRIASVIRQRLSNCCVSTRGCSSLTMRITSFIAGYEKLTSTTVSTVRSTISCRSDRFGRRLLVGGDKARYSEFRTAEITHDDDQAVDQFVGQKLTEDRLARRARRLLRRRWRGTFRRADPAATRNRGASRRNISCAAHRAACESPPRFRPDRHKRGTCCFSLCRWLPQARQAYDNCPRSRLPLFYLTLVNILFQRMFAGKLFSGSSDSQMKEALPTMWSSGTNPQKRESAELWRLSPIIQ